MALVPGARLGPYEIVGPVGAGGMGEVYKAHDTRLQRTVAVKVSREPFGERFRKETLAVAALNHRHIAKLYDVGPDYLVMEYVEGNPLRGPLPLAEALTLAGQIADALEHAHKNGVVHRDLKPSNILVTKDGVKVLDFGLAQRRTPASATENEATRTQEGTLLGTPRYMAPEQVEGKPADERTDVFAFGLLLYELLTGERAFDGRSAAGVMAAILEQEPVPVSSLKPATPPAVVKVVETCLAKDPADRWQSVRELRHALDWASTAGAPPLRRRWPGWALVATVVAAILVLAAGVALSRRRPNAARPAPVRLQLTLPPKVVSAVLPAVSPDGKRIAFAGIFYGRPPNLFVRPLEALTATEVPGTEASGGVFWSPDSRQIAFWKATGLWKIDLSGGSPQVVCKDCRGRGGVGVEHGATWGSTDVIVFSDSGQLFRVPAQGEEPEPLGALAPGETGRFWPFFLPDGVHYIYLSLASRREDSGIYAGALGSDLRKRLVGAEHTAAYSPPGYLVYLREGILVAQPFDAGRLALSGDPAPILDEEVARLSGSVIGGPASFSLSANGVLAWSPAVPDIRQMTWFDRSGRTAGTIGEPGPVTASALAPDEKTVAICRWESPTNRDVWLVDVGSGAARRLTFDPHEDCAPTWSPDGKTIIFFSDRRGVREIYRKPADGSGDDELVLASTTFGLNPEDWSADGRFLSYNSARPAEAHDIFVLPLSKEGRAAPMPFLATPGMESGSVIAPNGRYVAYYSNESGSFQVYVRELTPEGRAGPEKWQVSRTSRRSFWPRWRADGRELFFFGGPPASVIAVDVVTHGPTFRSGEERSLFRLSQGVGPPFRVSRDGQRFLFMVPANPPEPIRILVNWFPAGP